ncbi:tol-pal system-associated acyl-CoA thioesterase [Afifella pfennigii]|uniref:tol-pal system-associated acyl-CoA thioesterase n=1 Tax=Afifella pfennigii TaxID=209897 RepID=UPI00047AFDA7|nr:tol-pal system-associated acyl-CoA thioesterase [Afifella pfennigii]
MPEAPDGLSGRLEDGGHVLFQRIYFEDTDFSGLVYHARYLHFLERGRSDYLRLLGIHHRELAQEGLAFTVRRMEIAFDRPAHIDDVLRIVTRSEKTGGARLVLAQEIWREAERLTVARVEVALIDAAGRPRRLPPAVSCAFSQVSS